MAAKDKRQAILAAAERLLLKHGLRGTSMEAVAQAAGVAKATLYANFTQKEQICTCVGQDITSRWRLAFDAALAEEGDLPRRIASALTGLHRAAGPVLAAGLAAEAPAFPAFSDFDAQLVTRLEGELERAGVERPRFVAQLLLASAEGIARRAQSPAELGPALRHLAESLAVTTKT